MTERLYYDDPSLQEFDAVVRRAETRTEGVAVWLDRTAFYPTSGGQPNDLGLLGSDAVVGVEEDGSGEIVHLLPPGAALPTSGTRVHGAIDAARRFDHTQQHSGQHVLSAVLERLFGARTVSFHLGSVTSTIDLDRELNHEQIAHGELDANRVVWDDLPVTIRYATEAQARALPLRKEPVRSGVLRLIEIASVDLSACGGTHVTRTGAIGQIAIASWERFKGGQRVEFVCGGRALARHALLRDITTAAVRTASVLPGELPSAIERFQTEGKELRRVVTGLQTELAQYEGAALADAAEPVGNTQVVLAAMDADAGRLKALASAASRPNLLIVLVSRTTPALAVATRGADVALSCQELIARLLKQFGGRGGGRPDLAQCGGLQAAPDAILAAARIIVADLT